MSGLAVIITAAGSSSRMNNSLKKEYRKIDDIPVLIKTITSFKQTNQFDYIVITVPKTDEEYIDDLLNTHFVDIKFMLVSGGITRQKSVYNALKALKVHNPQYILIHDGARPWIGSGLILNVIKNTVKYQACIPVVEIVDAVKEINQHGFISKNLSKKNIKAAQTPQGFSYSRIMAAYQFAEKEGYSCVDDAEIYNLLYKDVYTIPGQSRNRKITYAHDIEK